MIVEKVVTQTPYISIDLAYQIVVLTVISIASFCIRMKREDLVYRKNLYKHRVHGALICSCSRGNYEI